MRAGEDEREGERQQGQIERDVESHRHIRCTEKESERGREGGNTDVTPMLHQESSDRSLRALT